MHNIEPSLETLRFKRTVDGEGLILISYTEILDDNETDVSPAEIEMLLAAMRKYLRGLLSAVSQKQSFLPNVEYTLLDRDKRVISKVFVPSNYWQSPHGQACDPLVKTKLSSSKQFQPTVIIPKPDFTQ